MNLWQGIEPSHLISLSILVPFIGALLVIATGKIPTVSYTHLTLPTKA